LLIGLLYLGEQVHFGRPSRAARLRSLIADEVVAPSMSAQVKGGKPNLTPFGCLSKIISRL
jgi:hypothetical protein